MRPKVILIRDIIGQCKILKVLDGLCDGKLELGPIDGLLEGCIEGALEAGACDGEALGETEGDAHKKHIRWCTCQERYLMGSVMGS